MPCSSPERGCPRQEWGDARGRGGGMPVAGVGCGNEDRDAGMPLPCPRWASSWGPGSPGPAQTQGGRAQGGKEPGGGVGIGQ